MKYLVLMYADPAATKAMTADQRDEVFRRHTAFRDEFGASGELLNGVGLGYPEDTLTLRWAADDAAAVNGPLADATEHATAYYVVECDTSERAREIAERVLDFHVVAVELRPIHDTFGIDRDRVSSTAG